ncbi:hypothetical protein BLNAU_14359 [Blattamonas nauphoetae]|uniref:Uncharacterized protein n=1 Tax=Blattamonas nauphoetae TaxID=2049346 RepID=A0ABQ9XHB6_9EUKA|nr:hypothetical protein BLNAU_14359 [Blattamonas nauphoetae]
MGKASECGNHVSECDTLCLMKFGGHENQTFSSFYSAAVQNATYTTRRDNTTSNTTHSSPIDAHFADMLDSFCTQKCVDVKVNSQKSNTIQSIAVDRPLQSRDGNEDTPITEDDEMPEDEPVDSNCMSKCRLHNMPICISEFDGCYFSCKDEFVKPSMSRLSDAKMRSPANYRTKVWKEGDTEGLAAEMGRLNDFEKGIDDLNATEEKYNQDGEGLKQQGEELKKKADEFRQRAETIKREAERHAANLKKERDEMWKTGKEEIEHAHEEGKEAISAAEAKVKELKEKAKEAKKRTVARFNNLKKEEDWLARQNRKKGERSVETTRRQEAGGADESSGSAGEAPQSRAQAVAPEENGRGQTRAGRTERARVGVQPQTASDQTEHRAGTPLAAGREE